MGGFAGEAMSPARIAVARGCAMVCPASAQVWGTGATSAEITPRDVEKTPTPSPIDNTFVRAGHQGLPHGECGPGPQPFIEKVDAGGTRLWIRAADADPACG